MLMELLSALNGVLGEAMGGTWNAVYKPVLVEYDMQ